MSRSYLKTPITGITTADSVAWSKQYRAGRERMRVRCMLADGDWELLGFQQVPWNEWDCERDGKRYWGRKMPKRMWRK